MSEPVVHVYPSLETLSEAAAERAAELIRKAPAGGRFSLALSGGSTPRRFHERLAADYREALPWERVHLFWGDERFVPLSDEASNYRMARETLIRHLPLPEENVHPVPTDRAAPEAAARALEEGLRRFFGEATGFDLMILGLGEDGHTASLFPSVPALEERERWVRAVEAPPYAAPRDRITVTLPLIRRSRHLFFLVSGEEKRDVLQFILHDPEEAAERYPAARVQVQAEPVEWFVDRAAYGPE